jgi:ubiquinone/menaquinone biosynthesis C-methylase UbiE
MMVLREERRYEFGELENEVRRLELRTTVLADSSEGALRQAGIERGMRVVDLGCDTGDMSLLLAKLVGPSGLVVGVDPLQQAVNLAERRVTVAGQCYWTRFIAADLNEFAAAGQFDAVVCRLTPGHLREPAATARRLAALVRRRGVI